MSRHTGYMLRGNCRIYCPRVSRVETLPFSSSLGLANPFQGTLLYSRCDCFNSSSVRYSVFVPIVENSKTNVNTLTLTPGVLLVSVTEPVTPALYFFAGERGCALPCALCEPPAAFRRKRVRSPRKGSRPSAAAGSSPFRIGNHSYGRTNSRR